MTGHDRPGHGKTLGLPLIRRFLDPDAVGGPQFIAAALLLVYLLQCAWLIRVETLHGSLPDSDHALCIYYGLQQWKGGPVAGTPESLRSESATGVPSAGRLGHLRVRDGYDQDRSPLYYLIAAAPMLIAPASLPADSVSGQLWAATPYLFFGVMLGGSLWYVARRLYGNAGGYIALALYCFSPAMIVNAAGGQCVGEMGTVWGAFGTVFTAIAVAHTLYAPREVVLWNWRRILLLGLSLALTVGNQFSLALLALVALLLMLWVAPIRKRAVLTIWATSCAVAAAILLLSYDLHPALLGHGLLHVRWLESDPRGLLALALHWHNLNTLFASSPPLMLALPTTLLAYFLWKRARYFGNTAPLLMALLMMALAFLAPNFPGSGFHLTALVFLLVFVAGVISDLLQTQRGTVVMAAVCGLLIASSAWNLLELARLAR